MNDTNMRVVFEFDISLLSDLLANITLETENNIDITPQTTRVQMLVVQLNVC